MIKHIIIKFYTLKKAVKTCGGSSQPNFRQKSQTEITDKKTEENYRQKFETKISDKNFRRKLQTKFVDENLR